MKFLDEAQPVKRARLSSRARSCCWRRLPAGATGFTDIGEDIVPRDRTSR